jgi:hypothetical protein
LGAGQVQGARSTKANPIITQSTPGLQLNKWGNIVADDGKLESTQTTSIPGVFAGGDIVTGGATVILAMGAGRRAAKSIATYLKAGKKWPITKEDVAAFVPPVPVSEKHAGASVVGGAMQVPVNEGPATEIAPRKRAETLVRDCMVNRYPLLARPRRSSR